MTARILQAAQFTISTRGQNPERPFSRHVRTQKGRWTHCIKLTLDAAAVMFMELQRPVISASRAENRRGKDKEEITGVQSRRRWSKSEGESGGLSFLFTQMAEPAEGSHVGNVTGVFVQHVQSALLIRCVACQRAAGVRVFQHSEFPACSVEAPSFPLFPLGVTQTAARRLRTLSPWRQGCRIATHVFRTKCATCGRAREISY